MYTSFADGSLARAILARLLITQILTIYYIYAMAYIGILFKRFSKKLK